jgi:hypothetical protein
MKKALLPLIFALLGITAMNSAHAQEPLKADAGRNQHFCFESDFIGIQLGGNPTASGGTPPYTYFWCSTPEDLFWMYGGETLSNPNIEFLSGFIAYVEVKDAIGDVAIDSVVITESSPQLNFLNDTQIDYYINSGDAVFLNVNVAALNPNSSFSWSPRESIVSDCTVSDGFWAKPITTTIYYLTAKDEHNCSETFFTHFYRVFVDEIGVKDYTECPIDIYPNPASQFFNITVSDEYRNAISNIKILDMLGNVVYNQLYNNDSIDISNIKNGIYLLVVSMDEKKIVKKLTIY